MSSYDPNETLRADNNPKFYSRFIWLGLGAIAFGVYSAYDATIGYPQQRERGLAIMEIGESTISEEQLEEFHKIAAEEEDHHKYFQLVAKEVVESDTTAGEWKALTEAKGWPIEAPKKLRSEGDIVMNYIMAVLSAVAAVWMLTTVYLSRGRWIQFENGVISTSWGQTFPASSVTQIEKRQWKDKGIARVKYEHEGRKRKFVVDDYKYHRKTTDEILRQIELIAGEDKITGGPAEEPPTDDDTVRQQADQTVMDAQAHS